MASTRFVVTPKVAATPTDEPAAPPETTPRSLPTSDVLEPTVAPEVAAVSKSYSGNIELAGEDGLSMRSLSMNLVFQGLEISGSGSIQGFGDVMVSGKEMVRGYEITLRGSDIQLRLTSGKGASMLKGSYLVAGKPIRGSWQAKLVP